MSLNGYSKEQLKEMSLIEVAHELLKSKKEPMAFKDIMDEMTNLLGLSEDEVKSKIAQFYTDLNIEGHFIGLGDNRWGLRAWYPVEQYEEEVVTVIKPKKKKAKKVADDDEDYDEEDIDYDDLDDFDDDLDDEEVDDLLDDTDDDEDLDEEFEDDDELIDDLDDEDLDEEDEDEEEKL
ncbi:DNA-directed RNA polymerase subunit delta [Cytobacillus horneckiae]|uniref:Probable DNA-directed RNA polymerase subunit delta n=1 Tax=Cytobacillus horneckiae TaxID=549687 RepID=A0A2N0ZFZ1_9BACI|nr:DNA-directed RNA polymerase subunit delta [Cytobacillus horneckiae]NRG44352.1 DNA-directed RNA polymerase subunit delta [Bacillus sp. CRN 9]MBN6885014.1 DNA-directed RNA polymerase subunit delta [Cytobacillus horneckiae]MCM3179239.1 DNA-directed RNA polymerase subunit delta [Cytobacillus horneckiae]MEC1154461.1 DNA-directed RNA polymerase subunit delta [Cytobacillus horneckiae]MED2937796.1 DNA-directed RNA polymerase subunit delta [Cytobacillus horneckiae]